MSVVYEVRVNGHLDGHWAEFLGGVAVRHDGNGTSVVTARVTDQAQLHGILAGLRDLGAPLVSVTEAGALSRCPLATVDWPRRTARLTIRPACAEDADATWGFRRLDSVCRWLTDGPVPREVYRARFADPARLSSTLVIEFEGEVIGDLMLRVDDAWAQTEVVDRARGSQAELAWVLAPGFEGHGYATEAAHELIRLAFEELGVRRVTATCFADNEASWRLMERVGMRRELHAVGDALHRSGEWLDTYGYALLREGWAR